MIRFATSNDRQAVKALWKSAFHDDDKFIDFYLDNCFETNDCLLYIQKGELSSMLFLIECQIENHFGKYIYAACTAKKFRRKGHMSELLKHIISSVGTENDFLCLVPATEKLYDYYSKFGFVNYFYNSIVEIENKNSDNNQNGEDLSFSDFVKLRNRFFGEKIVNWSDKALKYAFDENLFNGGRNIKIGDGYAIINEQNNICAVLEWAIHNFNITDFTTITKCDKIIVRTDDSNKNHCNGMILTNIDFGSNKFLSLVLD